MLINTFLDTEDFVHLYYPEDEPAAVAQGCGAGARMASKYPPRPPSPDYTQVATPSSSDMSERERYRAPPQPEPPPHRVRAADLYPRLRTHYDEPGLDVPFAPICGEFVQWVGRMADGSIIAMSNYRLHAQPRRRNGPGSSVPIRLIDALEIRDLLHLIVLCKNGRTLKCSFTTGEQCVEWWRRLNTAMAPMTSVEETFAAAYAAWAKEQPASSVHRELLRASHTTQAHWFGPEVERLGFTSKGAWRVTTANEKYELCPSYPPLLIVPATISDKDLHAVARFRAMRRVPAVVWRHRGTGAVIARSSQPEVGWLGWRSPEDEQLLAAFVSACYADRPPTAKQVKLLIVDARSYASAVTNRARGGGCECQQYYPHADIQFMCMPNIHHVRRSFQHMRALAAESADQPNWHSNLERTLWLQYVSGIARAAGIVCRAVLAGRPVLVHCSDGWDRTPQIVAAAQLLLDPYYRTLQGFRVLIEREWLDFGHKFADRCGHGWGADDPNERSPIFLQWLDWVHQAALQYPCSFEFNEAYLIKLATHVHSCMFGTFLCNTARERSRAAELVASVWPLLDAPAYRNHLYEPNQEQVLWVQYSVRSAAVWTRMFTAPRDSDDEPRRELERANPHTNGLMTKTRSCDNLLNEGEKRTAQRRCSDPSIAPDVMKLSMSVRDAERRESRALTDSCVDELPGLPRASDQVDGLHPDHFETPRVTRDLVSGSSSLERELCPAPPLVDISTPLDTSTPLNTTTIPVEMSTIPLDISTIPVDMSTVPEDISTVPKNMSTISVDMSTIPVDMSTRVETIPLVEINSRLDVPVNGARRTEIETPEEPPVFVCDTYTDVIGMAEAAREVGRTRNISITWRSISESSNQSSTGFDIADTNRLDNSLTNSLANSTPNSIPNSISNSCVNSHESSPLSNHNSTEVDVVNHNVTELNGRVNGVNGTTNGIDEVATKFLEVDLNGGEAATSSSVSSESEGEALAAPRRPHATRGSQLTLCPASPRRLWCTCDARTHGSSVCSETRQSWCGCGSGGRVRCVCGGAAGAPDPLDGLPPDTDPLQARLHQIILYQRKVVEELTGQLREAREALRLASPPAASPAPRALASPPRQLQQKSSSSAGSGSSSASEVEVGEEARGVVWLPDSAAPRCQHCRHHFWLARRRHHCRRCGGIFCSSCSEMSSWGACSVRLCRRCRLR